MTDAERLAVQVLEGIGRLSGTPMYANTTLCPDIGDAIAPLLAEVERLRGVVEAAKVVAGTVIYAAQAGNGALALRRAEVLLAELEGKG